MAKNLGISLLYDWYGEMLTEKQQEATELYYNDDLSLGEIAQHMSITRQGVRDSIKRAEAQLFEMEEQLGLLKKFSLIKSNLEEILEAANDIERINDRLYSSNEILIKTRKIKTLANAIAEQ